MELTESKSKFADRLNVSRGYISQLVKSGLPCSPSGEVRVDAALGWIRDNVRGGPGRPLGAMEGGSGDDLAAAKVRLLLAQAERAEMEIMKMRGDLIPREIVQRVNFSLFRQHRDHVLNFALRRGAIIAAEFGISPATFAPFLESELIEHLRQADGHVLPFRDETAAEAAGHCPTCNVNLNHPRAGAPHQHAKPRRKAAA